MSVSASIACGRMGRYVRAMADDQAASQSVSASLAARVISLIDLTDLDDEHRPDGIESLVARAIQHETAAVCVWPEYVERVAEAIRRAERESAASIRVATVVNFPAGDDDIVATVALASQALDDRADEIDLVLPYRSFLADDVAHPRAMVEAVAECVHGTGAHLKVILETGELRHPEAIKRASQLAIESGADFIKTSTGKTSVGATLEAVEAMAEVIATASRPIGLKPSGGIRTVEDAARYLRVVDDQLGVGWATPLTFRFGASSLLDDALAALAPS